MIKAVEALKHREIPPSLHFQTPNPKIPFEASPFYVNTELREWPTGETPRRAAVSSFGLGGTNAHVIIEEAPAVNGSHESKPWQVLVLSARSGEALENATSNLSDYLNRREDHYLADIAYTLQVGRRSFNHRRTVICSSVDDAVVALKARDPKRVVTHLQEMDNPPVTFLFPGLGDHYVNMAQGLSMWSLRFVIV